MIAKQSDKRQKLYNKQPTVFENHLNKVSYVSANLYKVTK